MTNLIKLERGSMGNKPCALCNQIHVPQNKCSHEALAKKITLLMEANRIIPSLLTANKDAVSTARMFQNLLKQADAANGILQEVLISHGEIGQQILKEYLERVNTWAKEHLSRGTSEQTQATEQSISQETNDKQCMTKPGENSPIILSP